MLIKDIIIRALGYIGREEIAVKISAGDTVEGEEADTLETLLYCFNAVENELARCYFSLTDKETLSSLTGQIYFSSFKKTPVKILSVKKGSKDADFALFPEYIQVDGEVEITYEYVPAKKTLDGKSEFADGVLTEKLIAAGAASEYCVINGEIKQAEFFENVYRREIDGVRRKKLAAVKFPPRRWV